MRGKQGRKIHVSWCIAWLSAGVLAGTALAMEWQLPTLFVPYALALLLILGALLLRKRSLSIVGVAFVAGALLGNLRGSAEQHLRAGYLPFINHTVVLSGTVSEDTSFGPHGDQQVRIKSVQVNQQPLPGEVWVSTPSNIHIRRSDKVQFQGTLEKGFGNLPASMFWARLIGHTASNDDIALNVRDWFASGIRKAIPEPQASLGVGYLVGQRSSLPATLDTQLKIVGLTHAVVASGYNLTILVGFARRSLLKISKYLATLASTLMIGSFMLVTGLSPSMSRAGLVTSLSLAAWYYGRTIHPLILLPFAAALTVLWNPAYVWGDLGWFLSFASFAGVILLAPLVKHYFWGNANPNLLRAVFIETLSAQLATLPIMVAAFHQYSPYALLANMLVLPLIPLAMLLTFISGLAGVILPSLAHFAGTPATLVLTYMTKAVDWVAHLPGAEMDVGFGALALGLAYAAVVLFALVLWRQTKHSFRKNITLIGEPL